MEEILQSCLDLGNNMCLDNVNSCCLIGLCTNRVTNLMQIIVKMIIQRKLQITHKRLTKISRKHNWFKKFTLKSLLGVVSSFLTCVRSLVLGGRTSELLVLKYWQSLLPGVLIWMSPLRLLCDWPSLKQSPLAW